MKSTITMTSSDHEDCSSYISNLSEFSEENIAHTNQIVNGSFPTDE